MKNSLAVSSAAFSATLFLLDPLDLYLRNTTFDVAPLATLIFLLVIALAASGLLITAGLIVPAGLRRPFTVLLTTLTVLLWIQGSFIKSTVPGQDKFFSELTPLPSIAIGSDASTIVWCVTIVLALLLSRYLGRFVKPVSVLAVLAQFASLVMLVGGGGALPIAYQTGPTTRNADKLFDFSHQGTNVLQIVLDATQSEVMQDLIESKGAEASFEGFTLYSDTVSMYNSTQLAIPSMLSSRYYDGGTIADFYQEAFHSADSVITAADAAGFSTSFSSFMPFYVFGDQSDSLIENLKRAFSRGVRSEPIISSDLLLVSLARRLPDAVRQRLLNHLWRTGSVRSVQPEMNESFARRFETALTASSTEPTFHFFHIAGGHRPYLRDGRPVTFTYDNYKAHTESALSAIDRAFEAMRKANVYDNTTIIVVGDHGVPDTHLPENPAPHLKPLIMIKPAHSRRAFTVSDAPISLADVGVLLKRAFDADGLTTGELDDHLRSVRDRRVDTFVSTGFDRYFASASLPRRSYLVTGPSADPESWHFRGKIVEGRLVPPKVVAPAVGQAVASPDFDRGPSRGASLSGGWSFTEDAGVWSIGTRFGIGIPGTNLPKGDLLVELSRSLNSNGKFPLDLSASVGGGVPRVTRYTSAGARSVDRIVVPGSDRRPDGSFALDMALAREPLTQADIAASPVNREYGIFLTGLTVKPLQPLVLGRDYGFPTDGEANAFKIGRWWASEALGSWSGGSSGLYVDIGNGQNADLTLLTATTPYPSNAPYELSLSVSDRPVLALRMAAGSGMPGAIRLPPDLVGANKSLKIEFSCTSLPAADGSGDRRPIDRCLFFRTFRLEPTRPYVVGEPLDFRKEAGQASSAPGITGQWQAPEAGGTWLVSKGTISFPAVAPTREPLALVLDGEAAMEPGSAEREVEITVGSSAPSTLKLKSGQPIPSIPLEVRDGAAPASVDVVIGCRRIAFERCLFVRSAKLVGR